MKTNSKIYIIIYFLLITIGGYFIFSSTEWAVVYSNNRNVNEPIILDLFGKSILYFGIIILISGIVGLFFEKYKK